MTRYRAAELRTEIEFDYVTAMAVSDLLGRPRPRAWLVKIKAKVRRWLELRDVVEDSELVPFGVNPFEYAKVDDVEVHWFINPKRPDHGYVTSFYGEHGSFAEIQEDK